MVIQKLGDGGKKMDSVLWPFFLFVHFHRENYAFSFKTEVRYSKVISTNKPRLKFGNEL